jgi:hypothetical protein
MQAPTVPVESMHPGLTSSRLGSLGYQARKASIDGDLSSQYIQCEPVQCSLWGLWGLAAWMSWPPTSACPTAPGAALEGLGSSRGPLQSCHSSCTWRSRCGMHGSA